MDLVECLETSAPLSKTYDIWKTIDDVNATLDSLSLISRGKPTKTGESHRSTSQKGFNNLICHPYSKNNVDEGEEKQFLTDANIVGNNYPSTRGRGTFISEFNKQRMPADKDATLHAELNELFPYNFSNEAIERHWVPDGQVVTGQFDDTDYELNEIENNIHFSSSNNEIEPAEAIFEARISSPPLDTSSSSKKLSETAIILDKVFCERLVSNSLNSVESIHSEVESEIETLKEYTSLVIEEKQSPPIIKKKKCRNALLNSLKRKGILEKQIEPIDKPLVLKTPDDFLVSSVTSHNNNNNSNDIPHSHTCRSFSCLLRNNANKFSIEDNDTDSFEYCPEDFPAL